MESDEDEMAVNDFLQGYAGVREWGQQHRSGRYDDDNGDSEVSDCFDDDFLSELHLSVGDVSKHVARLRLERTQAAGRRDRTSQQLPRSLVSLSGSSVVAPSRLCHSVSCCGGSGSTAVFHKQYNYPTSGPLVLETCWSKQTLQTSLNIPLQTFASSYRYRSSGTGGTGGTVSRSSGEAVITLIDLPLDDMGHQFILGDGTKGTSPPVGTADGADGTPFPSVHGASALSLSSDDPDPLDPGCYRLEVAANASEAHFVGFKVPARKLDTIACSIQRFLCMR